MIRELKEENKKLKDMLQVIAKAAASGKPLNVKELGIENMEEAIDEMNENEKLLDEIQKPFEEKLAESKAASTIAATPQESP